jgi:MinD-like ATPase involved in chromosome partitioning or flagellar assembly
VHSFRGGTGKSNITANLAALAAMGGSRAAVVDTDISSPGIHVLFGLDPGADGKTLNDYLWGACRLDEAAHQVPIEGASGELFVVPSTLSTGAISRILREGYDVGLLVDGLRQVIGLLDLDVLFIDTHPGLNDETLLSVTVSDALFVVLRPDNQDYLGTAVTVEVARKLGVPSLYLVVNKVPTAFDSDNVRQTVSEAYGAPVAAVLPHSDEMMQLQSAGLFALRYPDHPLTRQLRLTADIVASLPPSTEADAG